MKSQQQGIRIACLAVWISLSYAHADAVASPTPLPAPDADAAVWQVTQRDFHSETWEQSVPILDPATGKTRFERHKFVSTASGMNFLDVAGAWQRTREQFEVTRDGNFAVAEYGPHKLIVENNANSATALDFLRAVEGARLKMGPLGVR